MGPEGSTFDFSLDRGLSPDELEAVFRIVNRAVRGDLPRTTRIMSLDEARMTGAMMLFDEKYGDTVRVVSFGEFSSELCGGTHVDRTGQIGPVVPVAERSVGSGVRRIEFLAGEQAERLIRDRQQAAERAAAALHVGPEELAARVESLVQERRRLQKQLDEPSASSWPRGRGGGETAPIEADLGGVVSDGWSTRAMLRLSQGTLADGLLDQEASTPRPRW